MRGPESAGAGQGGGSRGGGGREPGTEGWREWGTWSPAGLNLEAAQTKQAMGGKGTGVFRVGFWV